MPTLRPYKMYRDVTCITLDFLKKHGICGLLLDIDGTLMPTREDRLLPDILAWISLMKSGGIKLFILSNSKRRRRVELLGRELGVPCLPLSCKPGRGGYLKAARALGLPPQRLAMVGDQIFTDIFGANRCNIMSILVDSTDTDLWYQPLRRVLELPFMKERAKDI